MTQLGSTATDSGPGENGSREAVRGSRLVRRRCVLLGVGIAAALLAVGGLTGASFVKSPQQLAADTAAPPRHGDHGHRGVLGYAISEAGGRFAGRDWRERRALLEGVELPAHRKLANQLEAPWSWDAEFETDLDDLVRLVESVASRLAGSFRYGAGWP